MAEVRQTLGDLRRGQQVGGNLSRYVEAKSELTQTVEDIKAQITNVLVPVLTAILKAAKPPADLLNEILSLMTGLLPEGAPTTAAEVMLNQMIDPGNL